MADGTCTVADCNDPVHCRHLCRSHYCKARRRGEIEMTYQKRMWNGGQCAIDGCSKQIKARGLCPYHYNLDRWDNSPRCTIPKCTRRVHSRGWCQLHYNRWRWYGDPTATPVWVDVIEPSAPGHRFCRWCKKLKPYADFGRHPRSKHGCLAKCKECVALDWIRNRERHLAKKAARNYGITEDDYSRLMASSCHVCGKTSHKSGRRLHIDHCHETGTIRGVLCHACNTILGAAEESSQRLHDLAAYLERHRPGAAS